MLVYSPDISPRLTYILDYVFSGRLGLNVYIESDSERFLKESGFKLNYSKIKFDDVFQIIPQGLLSETGINQNTPDVNISNNGIHLFANDEGDMHFDVFSACFWMISRYEEYQEFEADEHGRFLAKGSFAYKHDFVLCPVVDQWIMQLKQKLSEFYGGIKYQIEEYSILPTIDIDSPWCYKNKGIVRNIGGFFRDWIRVNKEEIPERLAVLSGVKKDSHFQFDWLKKLYLKTELKPIYFVLVGKYGQYDKTISLKNKEFIKFLKSLKQDNQVGIHPSYVASNNSSVFEKELDVLSDIINEPLTKSRQHFLKITLPDYYEMLRKIGVKDDYSMGFADHAGFRAGTSRPYKFYNLITDEATELMIHPFSVMDVSLAQYQQKTPEEALIQLASLIQNIKNVDGLFVSLWHNESLSERMEWKGWKRVYTEMLSMAVK